MFTVNWKFSLLHEIIFILWNFGGSSNKHMPVPAVNVHWNDDFIINWIFSNISLYLWLYLIYLVIDFPITAMMTAYYVSEAVLSFTYQSLSKTCLPDLLNLYTW